MSSPGRWLTLPGLLIGVLAVSISAVLIRWAEAPALSIAFYRCLGGTLVLAPVALRARRDIPPLTASVGRQLCASGVFLALHFALWTSSLDFTTVASSVVLLTMSPIFVGIGAAVFLHEPPSAFTWMGMVIAMAGAAAVGAGDFGGVQVSGRALIGDLLALGGAVTIAGYLLIGRAVRQRLPTSVYATAVYGIAAIALGAACVLGGIPLTGFDAGTWLAIGGLILGPQLLGHTMFNWLLATMSATIVSIVALAEPVGATILAYWLLGETPTGLLAVGGPLILCGVAIATIGGRRGIGRRRRPGPPAEKPAIGGPG